MRIVDVTSQYIAEKSPLPWLKGHKHEVRHYYY
jgi:hypothetical protein